MSPLWVLPLVVLAAGAVAVAVTARRLTAEVRAARPAIDELRGLVEDSRSLHADGVAALRRGQRLAREARQRRAGR